MRKIIPGVCTMKIHRVMNKKNHILKKKKNFNQNFSTDLSHVGGTIIESDLQTPPLP